MEDLIKEFARQAGFKVNWQHEDVQAIKMAQYKEFTELIVKECVRVCNKQTPNWKGEYATAFGDGVEFCISGIKEHFGVEE